MLGGRAGRARPPPAGPPGWKTPQQGAATSVLLAASPLVQGVAGHYFEDCNEAVVIRERGDGLSGVLPHAVDADDADRLRDRDGPAPRVLTIPAGRPVTG